MGVQFDDVLAGEGFRTGKQQGQSRVQQRSLFAVEPGEVSPAWAQL